jgi:hypothetical protein
MSSPAIQIERDQFTVPIRCPKCGQAGDETWEENSAITWRGPQSQFVSRSPGFRERLSAKGPERIEVVCRHCGTVLPD